MCVSWAAYPGHTMHFNNHSSGLRATPTLLGKVGNMHGLLSAYGCRSCSWHALTHVYVLRGCHLPDIHCIHEYIPFGICICRELLHPYACMHIALTICMYMGAAARNISMHMGAESLNLCIHMGAEALNICVYMGAEALDICMCMHAEALCACMQKLLTCACACMQ